MARLNVDSISSPIVEFSAMQDEHGLIIDLTIVEANAAAVEMFPTEDNASPIGRTLLGAFPDVAKADLPDRLMAVVKTGKAETFEYRPDYDARYAGVVLNIAIGPTADGCIMTVHNVTEIARQRDAALARYDLMQAACDGAVNGVAIACATNELLYVNPAFCDLLEYSEAELLQMSISDILHPDELANRYEQAEKLVANKIDQYVLDRRYIKKSGEEVLLSVAVSSVDDPDGHGQLSVGHFRDVYEERQAQQALEDALTRAEEGTRLKSEFLANMSHEIRTPLNGVIGMAQVLAHSDLTDEQAEHLSIIRDSSGSLMSLLNDILDLSKVEAGRLDINPTDMDPRHKLSRVFKLHEPAAQEKGIDLNLVIHPSVPSQLRLDPVRVRQCVDNLVSNAVKFTSVGQVVIAVTSKPVDDGHDLVVHVSDTGLGIAPEKLDTIFDSFQQADGSTTRNYGGTGLGLTITRKLAQLMGGDLSVVSRQGRGSVFTLTLRAEHVETLVEPSQTQRLRIEKDRHKGLGFAGRKILIVDDNVINRQVARSFLKTYDFEAFDAKDGFECLEKLDGDVFDLVLMDIHMPGMDGVSAFEKIRAGNSLNKNVPVVALTADAMSGDRERFLGMGMNAYVSKPLNERELMTEVGRALDMALTKPKPARTG